MAEVLNLVDSYNWFKGECLTARLFELGDTKEYVRYPIKRIEREEKAKGINPPILPSESIFLKIVLGYLRFLLDKLFEGNDVRLGSRLGIITIRGRKVKPKLDEQGNVRGLPPSWSKTKAFWSSEADKLGITFEEYLKQVPRKERKLIYCFNEHSAGIKYRILWLKSSVVVKNKTLYGLTFNRVNRRRLWSLINQGKEYHIIEKSF